MSRNGTTDSDSSSAVANIAVIGAGWWSQGWHLPSLHHNPKANLMAIVDTLPHPTSNLNPDLESLEVLKDKYKTQIFASVQDMLEEIGSELDGVLIATPHATHYGVCRQVKAELNRRRMQAKNNHNDNNNHNHKCLHILMEKPMTTDIQHAIDLYEMIQDEQENTTTSTTTTTTTTNLSKFWINHSANYRIQAKMARQVITSGRLGPIRHITASFASPLKWIFMDPACRGWNEPSDGMLGNGFAWGQSSHLFAFLYHICPNLTPLNVFCNMTHAPTTGADVSHSATITCSNDNGDNDNDDNNDNLVVMNISGTTLLPGNAHSHPPVPKQVQIDIFGLQGSLHYQGNDRDPSSGRLELRHDNGSIEVLYDAFHFENLDCEGSGPESLQNFVQLCCGGGIDDGDDGDTVYEGANIMDGLRSIQTIDAMYRSHASRQLETVRNPPT